MNNIAKIVEKQVSNLAISNINKCCVWLFGQPKMEKSIEKYKKENGNVRKSIHKMVK